MKKIADGPREFGFIEFYQERNYESRRKKKGTS
jgi:hypothetical protein